MEHTSTQAIVLAAGNANRFKTKKNKQLEPICGKPMVIYQLHMLNSLSIPTILVLGENKDETLKQTVQHYKIKDLSFATQKQQLGTGDAVASAKDQLTSNLVLILNGDMPLISADIIKTLYKKQKETSATIAFLSTNVIDPTGYGRVINDSGKIYIIEDKECTNEQKEISTINAGAYLVDGEFLKHELSHLLKSSLTGEYYITDIVNHASEQGKIVTTFNVPYDNVRGVNTLEELWAVEQIKRAEIIRHWMLNGVRFELAQSTHVDHDVTIKAGSYIGSGVHLKKGTTIGESCTIQAYSILENATLENNVIVDYHSVIQDSTLQANAHVGPFARLRNNAIIGEDAQIGNFVEVKNSTIGTKSKAKHLAYLGDATLGQNVNIGAGTITCNHDGANKHKTVIDSNAYIGSNNTLIAPLHIQEGAYTAAGSTINKDVPKDALAIGRAKQENKEDYATKLREKIKKNSDSSKNDKHSFVGATKSKNFEHNL
jgi:bifunctional UDP-N-acetylglucosamine pyrophosphorylase/glucosamine-1-phosphate N-acetyltransferase